MHVLRDDAIDGRDTALTMLDSVITDRTLLSQTTKAPEVSSLALGQQQRVKMLQQMVWDQFADWKADGSISSRMDASEKDEYHSMNAYLVLQHPNYSK